MRGVKNIQRGFTIVELLIVIVVIGILAAIVIVAYNGIQTRAQNTITIQAVAEYVKGLNSYASANGHYPIDSSYPCLGPLGIYCGKVSPGADCFGPGSSSTSSQASFDTEMKKIFGNKNPATSSQEMSCGGTMYSGAYYLPSTGANATLWYFLKGDQPCEGIGGVQSLTKSQQDDATRCAAVLPTAS